VHLIEKGDLRRRHAAAAIPLVDDAADDLALVLDLIFAIASIVYYLVGFGLPSLRLSGAPQSPFVLGIIALGAGVMCARLLSQAGRRRRFS